MYNFIDTREASVGANLPSEALKINGEYIENIIAGYRTLSVSGRESLSPELEVYETGVRDGSKLKSKRYPARTIIVKYQLIAETNEAFREAYNKLGRILDVEDAELIFNDENDKFYIGTPSHISDVEPGKNAVTGEIEFFCADPFKYSVVEYMAKPGQDGSVLIDYNGTYKSFPILEADFFGEDEAGEDGESEVALTGNGDCGYVAFFDENEKIIQLGDPDEKDGETVEKAQTLTNQTFLSNTSWGTTAKKLWAVNKGTVVGGVKQLGNVAMKVSEVATDSKNSTTILNKKQSDGGAPVFYYTVTAKATERKEKSVKITAAITASLGSSGSYFGHGYSLAASLYIGGAWHNVNLKSTKDWWEGKTGHTVNLTVTVSNIDAKTTSLTGIKFKAYRTDSVGGSAGILSETACSNLAIDEYGTSTDGGYFLTASDYGTATDAWHGPTITRTITADATGEVGAKNFTFTYKHKLCMSEGATNEIGSFQVHLSDANGNSIAGVRIFKNQGGKYATLAYYVKGVKVLGVSVDLTYKNKYLGTQKSLPTSSIVKSGSKITFNVAGNKKTFTDTTLTDVMVTKITFAFEQYSSKTLLAYNGVYWAKFVKNNCDTWREIPNKFSANDVVEADCKNGQIYLNGTPSPELGALGNDWEEFYLKPGLNQIGTSYSEWVADAYAPSIKVRYREVFL